MSCLVVAFIQILVLTSWISVPMSAGIFDDDGVDKRDQFGFYQTGRGIISKDRLLQARSFFQLFNIPYIMCFFAAKGKWPFIPPLLQVKVNQVSRSLFVQDDDYIRNYCHEWFTVVQCYRPFPPPVAPSPTSPTTTKQEVETFDPGDSGEETTTTPCTCTCGVRNVARNPSSGIVVLDRAVIGNVSVDTIQTTIEFLKSFLPPPTKRKKRPGIMIKV